MANIIYTAAGCARCKIAKRYLQDNGIDYAEFDIREEGKDAFAQFYRDNRKDIFRDENGVEFPVFYDGQQIRQGVSVIIGYLIASGGLDGFIGRSLLHGEWLDGIDISGGDPAFADQLVQVMSYLKKNGLKIQVVTTGRNSKVLELLLQKVLVDRVIVDVKGPVQLYQQITGTPIDAEDLRSSIELSSTAPQYSFVTTIAPVVRSDGQIDYITPEEIGSTAHLIEEASGKKKNPYTLYVFDPRKCEDERFKSIEALPSSAMFKYRTAARRYQVMTEIEK